MPNDTEKARKEKRSSALGVALFGLLQLVVAASFVALCFIPGAPKWLVALFAVLAVFCLGLMLPALYMLRLRFREIDALYNETNDDMTNY